MPDTSTNPPKNCLDMVSVGLVLLVTDSREVLTTPHGVHHGALLLIGP